MNDAWYWDRYWNANRIAACCAGEDLNYGGAILLGWQAFFDGFDTGSRLLDIGTGNGAVALMAAAAAQRSDKSFEIHAVDSAAIDPVQFVPGNRALMADVTFHGSTKAESLPFEAAVFDGVTGQYALEYTDIPATLRELNRVCRSGARLRFVIHAQEGSPVTLARASLDELTVAFVDSGIGAKARECMRTAFAFERAATDDPRKRLLAQNARESYVDAARALDARYASSPSPEVIGEFLNLVRGIWDRRSRFSLDEALSPLDAFDLELSAHRARLGAMCYSARDRSGILELLELCEETGFDESQSNELRASGDQRLLGWVVTATREDRAPCDYNEPHTGSPR